MPSSLLDLSVELQLHIITFLNTPTTSFKAPAAYFAPRICHDVANLSSCCKALRRLAAPVLYRNIRLQNNEKGGNSIQAVAKSPWAGFVRELNFEGSMEVDDEWEEPVELPEEDFPASVEETLSHLHRFPNLAVLSIQFKLGDTEENDSDAAMSAWDTWTQLPDPFHDFEELRRRESRSEWKALMARTYNAVSRSEHPGSLRTLELRNLLPSGVSSFTTDAWQAFLGTLQTLRLTMHSSQEGLNLAFGYIGFIENLGLLFSHIASVTEFHFAASEDGMPGLPSMHGSHHVSLPLRLEDMPSLKVFELQCCFISESTARFIASHNKTLKRIKLDYCYSGASCYNAAEHTTWATFFNIIADSLDTGETTVLEEFLVSPQTLGKSRHSLAYKENPVGVLISGEDREIELARRMSEADPRCRPFAYATIDDKYGMLCDAEEQNLNAFLAGRDQAAFNRVMASVVQ